MPIPELTASHALNGQFLEPFYKELKNLNTHITELECRIENTPAPDKSLITTYLTAKNHQKELVANINNYDILFARFMHNDINHNALQEPQTPIFDLFDYAHTLYVAQGAFNQEKDSYARNDTLLAIMARHTQLQCGTAKWIKTLATPTTDINQLTRIQKAVSIIHTNQSIKKELAHELAMIKKLDLESSFLSFWNDEKIQEVTSYAPFPGNGSFAPLIDLLRATGSVHESLECNAMLQEFNENPSFIDAANWTTFIQDAGVMLLGAGMFAKGWEELKHAASSLPKDFSYLGSWRIVILPIAITLVQKLSEKIVDRMLDQHLYTLYQQALESDKTTLQRAEYTMTHTPCTITLSIKNQNDLQPLATHMASLLPTCTICMPNTTTITIKLSDATIRTKTYAHPLVRHKTLATVIIPSVVYLLACHLFANTPLLSDTDLFPIPFTEKKVYAPGFAMLPWHAIQTCTCLGLLPATAYQNFIKTPQKSLLKTTHSIQAARKIMLDLGLFINHVKNIHIILARVPELAACVQGYQFLDIEHYLNHQITTLQSLINNAKSIPNASEKYMTNIKRLYNHFNAQKEHIKKLFDSLAAHANQTERLQPHSWINPQGLIHNLNIRFGSSDLLASYEMIVSSAAHSHFKEIFCPWIEALGEVDFLVSLATLLDENKPGQPTFCFATYQQNTIPSIQTTGLWFPHLANTIKKELIVTNNFSLGNNNASTAIISGPTEGGKSTFERALATAVLLAQTVGLVPAQSWAATPFSRVLIASNAHDNFGKKVQKTTQNQITTGTSGFRDEVESIKRIINEHKKLKPEQHTLVIIDELFQKVQRSGDLFSSLVIEQNFINPTMLSVIVTHREQPKLLEAKTHGACQNYHFVLNATDNTLRNTYTLAPGAIIRHDTHPVTLEDILQNNEDAYNVQLMQEANIIAPIKP